jgi:uncharacterized protein (TIGR02246 family)
MHHEEHGAMNTLGFVLSGMMVGLGMVAQRRSKEGDAAEALARIRELHETDWAASKAYDVETLRSLWTEDCVLLQPGQEPIIGDEALWAYMQAQVPGMQENEILEYRHDFEEVNVLGDWAYEWGTFYGSYRSAAGGKIVHERARLFRMLRRQRDGSWKVSRAIWHTLPTDGGGASLSGG